VDEDGMRQAGHWLGLELCVFFSALTLMAGWPVKPLIPEVFFQNRWRTRIRRELAEK